MMFFDNGRDHAADADTVTAHDHRLLFPVFIQELRALRLAVFRSQLEYMSQLDRHFPFKSAFMALGTLHALGTFPENRTVAVAGRALQNGIFPDRRGHQKFMGHVPAHVPGIRLDDHGVQAAAAENILISFIHQLIVLFKAFKVTVETVRVFHDEFAGPHDAKARA